VGIAPIFAKRLQKSGIRSPRIAEPQPKTNYEAPESRLRKFEQGDKWSFFLKAAKIDANRRDHEQTTAPEPQLGFQGEGGAFVPA
jgi:hypothetical protein